MAKPDYRKDSTALLFVDPHSDFLSEDGRIWQRLKPIAEETGLLGNLKTIGRAMRRAGMRVFIVPPHCLESGTLAYADLDRQLRQHGITHVVVVGLFANASIESTARAAMELGYHVTWILDATAAFTMNMVHPARELGGPPKVHAVLKTSDLVQSLSSSPSSQIAPAF